MNFNLVNNEKLSMFLEFVTVQSSGQIVNKYYTMFQLSDYFRIFQTIL